MRDAHSQKKIRRTFFFLLLLFMVPLLLASWMVMKREPLLSGTTQHGQLIQPPLDIARLNLIGNQHIQTGHWLLLYVNPKTCETQCEKALYDIRQIRTATGKEIERVERGVLTFSSTSTDDKLQQMLRDEFEGTSHFVTSEQAFGAFVKNSGSEKEVLQSGGIYVVDPLGNVMMFYSLHAEPMGIFKDLTKLLKLSHIG